MVRIPEAGRFEFRLADGAANPYLLQAGLLAAGLAGLAAHADPGPPSALNMVTEGDRAEARRLPLNLLDALRAFEASAPLRAALGEEFTKAYLKLKRQDWAAYARSLSAWEVETTLDV
jgi:glutamine synthetase